MSQIYSTVENKLDEADQAAARSDVRYSGEELFARARRRVREETAMESVYCHRDEIYVAEMSRLSGAPTYTPEEMDEKMEALFCIHEKGTNPSDSFGR